MNVGDLRRLVAQLDELGIEDQRAFTVKILVSTTQTRDEACFGVGIPDRPAWLQGEIDRAAHRSEPA
ncbi:hypothetical protein [Mycolicibacterium sphagni]|uniref:hypothetical protein n=1 Tax=Mycolicibacterium sphagni TaxID=1786 RepID=UPI0021F34E70|nr:hypothetical protein [Mycolicibacterium sphagni]MCV7174904.1 hypothetical protein [Mycolicibacterium sphagni]